MNVLSITLTRKNIAPWGWSKGSKHVGAILSVLVFLIEIYVSAFVGWKLKWFYKMHGERIRFRF